MRAPPVRKIVSTLRYVAYYKQKDGDACDAAMQLTDKILDSFCTSHEWAGITAATSL